MFSGAVTNANVRTNKDYVVGSTNCGPQVEDAVAQIGRDVVRAMRGGPTTVRIRAPDKKCHLAPADVPDHVIHLLGRHWRRQEEEFLKAEQQEEAVRRDTTGTSTTSKNTLAQCSPPPPNIRIRRSQEPNQRGHDKRRRVGFRFDETAAGKTQSPGVSSISEYSSSSDDEQ